MTQTCISCQKIKNENEFSLEKTKIGKNYYRSTCKKCRNSYRVTKRRQKEHGMTLEEFNNLLEKQNHLCAICKINLKELDTRDVHLDHCHTTEVVRGILCSHCNLGIGHFSDDVSCLQAAINYLEIFKIPTGSLTMSID